MRTPRLPSVFRNVRTRPRGFNFQPRYYDAEKEAFEKRVRLIEQEVVNEKDREAAIAKLSMKRAMRGKREETSRHFIDHGRTLRLAIILGILLSMAVYLYQALDL